MKVIEIMERSGMKETGRTLFYIKEALEEMAMSSETHTETITMDITKDKRFYNLPNKAVKILDIRCLNHENGDNEYRSIPRTIYEPFTEDSDGI
tara:strand:+ start:3014 stop:3295 length:282 start_codon:yes stop_codon:yes gene_type:complete